MSAVRLLTLHIQEPLPGLVLPRMAAEVGNEETVRRYRAIVLTTLRQLKGLGDTRLRIIADPEDAAEALRFWLLPLLAERWQATESVFRSDGWEIDFENDSHPFAIEATGNILCPFLGARWVHMAMLGIERGTHRVIGRTNEGEEFFRAQPRSATPTPDERILPELPVISRDDHWQEALESPLGAALKRALEETPD